MRVIVYYYTKLRVFEIAQGAKKKGGEELKNAS
jgi:hypothetical protein